MALILHKGVLEPNKTKDGRHTSYMVYGALAPPQLSQPEVTAMCDNKHRSLQKTFSCVVLFFFFLVAPCSASILKVIVLSCSKNHPPVRKQSHSGLMKKRLFSWFYLCACSQCIYSPDGKTAYYYFTQSKTKIFRSTMNREADFWEIKFTLDYMAPYFLLFPGGAGRNRNPANQQRILPLTEKNNKIIIYIHKKNPPYSEVITEYTCIRSFPTPVRTAARNSIKNKVSFHQHLKLVKIRRVQVSKQRREKDNSQSVHSLCNYFNADQ